MFKYCLITIIRQYDCLLIDLVRYLLILKKIKSQNYKIKQSISSQRFSTGLRSGLCAGRSILNSGPCQIQKNISRSGVIPFIIWFSHSWNSNRFELLEPTFIGIQNCFLFPICPVTCSFAKSSLPVLFLAKMKGI